MSSTFAMLMADPEQVNAVAAVAGVVVAAAGLFTAGAAVWISRATLNKQDKHNRLSVKPIPFVALADYPHMLRVKIANYGSGPLIIRQVSVTDGTRDLPTLQKWMPPLPESLAWSNRTSAMTGRSVLPAHELILLELKGDVQDKTYKGYRDACRKILSRLTVTCVYTDIYEQDFDPIVRSLRLYSQRRQIGTGDDFGS